MKIKKKYVWVNKMTATDDIFNVFDEIEQNYGKKLGDDEDNDENIKNYIEEDDVEDICTEEDVCVNKKGGCKHKNIVSESGTYLCSDCGLELSKVMSYEKDWRYYGSDDTRKNSDPNRCHIRKTEDKSIYKDVENFGFSEKVVNMANDIYSQVTRGKIYRGNSRKAIIFGCIFHSIKINGKAYTCESLREIFQLDRKIILRGLKHVSLNAPKSSQIRMKPSTTNHDLIEEYMNKFSLNEDEKKEVILIYQKIKNKSTIINRSRPQSVTSSLMYYYLCKKKGANNINMEEFIKQVKLSKLTIDKISKEIESIIN